MVREGLCLSSEPADVESSFLMGSLSSVRWVGVYRKGLLLLLSLASIGSHSPLDAYRSASREDNPGAAGSARQNLSLKKLWEGEEDCGCGRPWPEMFYCRPHTHPPPAFFFFNLKYFSLSCCC